MELPYVKLASEPSVTRSKNRITKRTLKFLSICRNPYIQKRIIKSAPDSIIKGICNAAFNIQQNPDIKLSKKEKSLFRKYKLKIGKLTHPRIPISKKRKIIQTGGGPFLIALVPALLSTALSTLGSAFINFLEKRK